MLTTMRRHWWLPGALLALALVAPHLLILTPLTRPEIRPEWGWNLMASTTCTAEERKVRVRWYSRNIGE